MALQLPNGSKAKNDKENMTILGPHCEKLLNNKNINTSPQALTHIRQRDQLTTLDDQISNEEIDKAIRDLKNNK